MNGWAIAWLVVLGGAVMVSAAKHGEPKGNYHLGHTLLSAALEFFILYKAGIFN
jgi:hypothetical protein